MRHGKHLNAFQSAWVVDDIYEAASLWAEKSGIGPFFVAEYEGEEFLLLIPQIASVPAKSLKNPIGSLSHLRDEIIAALDFAITGI